MGDIDFVPSGCLEEGRTLSVPSSSLHPIPFTHPLQVPSLPASTQTTKNEKNSKPAAVAKEPIPVSERTSEQGWERGGRRQVGGAGAGRGAVAGGEERAGHGREKGRR